MAQQTARSRAPANQERGKSRGLWIHEDHIRHRDYSPTLGRFIERDPIGFEAGDSNWYRFVANGPTGRTDPSGFDWLDAAANFAAGVSDSLTMGATSWVRRQFSIGGVGVDSGIDYEGGSYIAGQTTEFVVETTVTLGGGVLRKTAARYAGQAGRYALEGGARQTFRRIHALTGQGGIVHHINPIRQGRFPLPFTQAARGHWNMTWLQSGAQHTAAHQYLRRLDQLDYVRTWTSPIRSGGNAIMQHIDMLRAAEGASGCDAPDVTVEQTIHFDTYLLLEE